MKKNWKIVEADESTIKKLELSSALTIEGLNIESFGEALEFIDNECGGLKEGDIYTWNGELFNEIYNLKGRNAYTDDLTFFCVPLDLALDIQKLSVTRFQFQGRWLDDIVYNNRVRQSDIDNN